MIGRKRTQHLGRNHPRLFQRLVPPGLGPVVGRGFVLRQLSQGLIERRLERPLVELKQQFSLVNVLSLL
jgi:hypothetical protein